MIEILLIHEPVTNTLRHGVAKMTLQNVAQLMKVTGFLAILLFLLFPTFLQLSYFSYFLLKIA
jgi:hypothetical protein